MIQLETDGILKKLACDKGARLCFISTDGEGFDAETIEDLLVGAGITSLSEMDGKNIEIAINISDT
jgi:hypothetical protein